MMDSSRFLHILFLGKGWYDCQEFIAAKDSKILAFETKTLMAKTNCVGRPDTDTQPSTELRIAWTVTEKFRVQELDDTSTLSSHGWTIWIVKRLRGQGWVVAQRCSTAILCVRWPAGVRRVKLCGLYVTNNSRER